MKRGLDCRYCKYVKIGELELRKQNLGTAVGHSYVCGKLNKEVFFEDKGEMLDMTAPNYCPRYKK